MGKVILIIIGSLAAVYCVAAIVQMINTFLNSDPANAYSVANTAASVAPVVIGLLVSLICFQQAFARSKKDTKSENETKRD